MKGSELLLVVFRFGSLYNDYTVANPQNTVRNLCRPLYYRFREWGGLRLPPETTGLKEKSRRCGSDGNGLGFRVQGSGFRV